MSQFGQQRMDSFQVLHGQVWFSDKPSHNLQNDVETPLSPPDTISQTMPGSTQQQTKTRPNTAFKVLLTVVHKILKREPSTTKMFKCLLSQVNRNQNNSTAIKLMILAKKAGLIHILKNQFKSRAQQRLMQLSLQHNWTEERSKQAVDWKQRIISVINSKSLETSIQKIWKGHNHKNKHNNSADNVTAFNNKIKGINKDKLIKKH